MIADEEIQQLQELVNQSQSVLLVVAAQANDDQVISAAALFFSLEAQGKQVEMVAPAMPHLQSSEGLPEIRTQLGNRDLMMSFAYQAATVDKVSYHIDEETQTFNLVIKPQKGVKPLDSTSVQFSYTGAEADLIILVGVHNLEDLEQLYFGYEQLYEQGRIVTLHTFKPSFGLLKLDGSGVSSLSEAVTHLLMKAQWPIPVSAATHLLSGIEQGTDNFGSLVATAETFEAVAWLLRAGARRNKKTPNALPIQATTTVLPVAPVVRRTAKNGKANGKQKNSVDGSVIVNQAPVADNGGLKYQPSGFGPAAR